MGLGSEWRHAWKRWVGNFGDFWKKQLVEIWSWTKRVQFVAYGMRRAFIGSEETVSIIKIVSLSLSLSLSLLVSKD